MSEKRDADNLAFALAAQRWLAREGHYAGRVDGWAGAKTRAAFVAATGEPAEPVAPWPEPTLAALTTFYGPPAVTDSLVTRVAPYPLRLAWDTERVAERITCHRLVADSLLRVLAGVLDLYGSVDEVRRHRMDLYGGCYSPRRMRGGSSWSLHAWGAAIDLDPVQNGLRTRWPGVATMPVEVVELFEAEGWLSGGRTWGRDAMHFQATRA